MLFASFSSLLSHPSQSGLGIHKLSQRPYLSCQELAPGRTVLCRALVHLWATDSTGKEKMDGGLLEIKRGTNFLTASLARMQTCRE